MQAVILAAGTGSRIVNISNGTPKCLLQIGGKTLIEHQLEALSEAGIGQVLIVVGYKAEEVKQVVGAQASYVYNERYEDTNSLYSLSLATGWINGPFILLNSDVYFHPEILHRVIAKGTSALAYDSTSNGGQEQTKVVLREGKLIDIGKDVSTDLSRGESLGLLYFDKEGSDALRSRVKAIIESGGEKSWVMEALRVTCRSIPIQAVNVAGLPWVEIDFPVDYTRAQKEVCPAINKSRWSRGGRWRKFRWVSAAAAALFLIAAGGIITLSLSGQNTMWSSASLLKAEEFVLSLPQGSQQWWIASCRDTIRAHIFGPSQVRVEVRMVLPPETEKPQEYVVQVTLDGKPEKYRIFKSTPDKDADASGMLIGDRDRIEFELSKGNHSVDVNLLAGHSEKYLVRVRYPENDTDEEEDEQ